MSAKFNKNGIVTCTPIDRFNKVSILKNDIDVGENLLINSDFHNGVNNWTMDSGTLTFGSDTTFIRYGIINVTGSYQRILNYVSNVWKKDQVYSVSFYAKSDVTGTTIIPSRSLADYGDTFSLTTEWGRYICNITSTVTVSDGTLSLTIGTLNTNVYIANVKLEEGSKATPWCPNSEDGFGDTPDTYKNPIYAKDFIEL